MVVTLSSGCAQTQSPKTEWLFALGPVTNIFFPLFLLIGNIPSFFRSTIDFLAALSAVFKCSSVKTLSFISLGSTNGFSKRPNLNFA